MQILFYVLMLLSSLLGIVVGGSGFVLGLVTEADQDWGWIIILCSLLYLAHPALLYWLFKKVHEMLAMWLTTLFIVSSTVLVFFL
jgi:hypothetical protein